MRYIFIGLISLSMSANAQIAHVSKPKVDLRVELLSIVFRLAGNTEYSSNANAYYVQKINAHFDKFKDHDVVSYARHLRESDGIGYDAVMALAVQLDSLPQLNPIVPFSKNIPDNRWNEKTLSRFTDLLRRFYHDADCQRFFDSNKAYYNAAETRFYALFNMLDIEWYGRFYGKAPNESFKIVVGLGIGGSNFGPHIDLPNQSRDVYAIIGAFTFEQDGMPVFEEDNYLPTLIHEFNHSFVNYLIEKYKAELEPSAQVIFDKEKAKMKRQAYTRWETMINEATVRAAVIRYLSSHNTDTTKADVELKRQLANGFVWMKELVDLLKQYERNRNTYPTLETFMPVIVVFYKTVGATIDTYEANYQKKCAQVVTTLPINDDGNVSPKTTEIILHFSKRLDGVRYFFGPGPKGAEHYPKPVEFKFMNDNATLVIKVALAPNTDYQVNMIGRLMRTYDGYSVQDYVLNFKTGKE